MKLVPGIKNIEDFTELFEKVVGLHRNSFLSHSIPGHLMVELLLVKIVGIKMPTPTKPDRNLNTWR